MKQPQTTTRSLAIDYAVYKTVFWPIPHSGLIEMSKWAEAEDIEKIFASSIACIRQNFREMMSCHKQ